jgi:hypothetical protein
MSFITKICNPAIGKFNEGLNFLSSTSVHLLEIGSFQWSVLNGCSISLVEYISGKLYKRMVV